MSAPRAPQPTPLSSRAEVRHASPEVVARRVERLLRAGAGPDAVRAELAQLNDPAQVSMAVHVCRRVCAVTGLAWPF